MCPAVLPGANSQCTGADKSQVKPPAPRKSAFRHMDRVGSLNCLPPQFGLAPDRLVLLTSHQPALLAAPQSQARRSVPAAIRLAISRRASLIASKQQQQSAGEQQQVSGGPLLASLLSGPLARCLQLQQRMQNRDARRWSPPLAPLPTRRRRLLPLLPAAGNMDVQKVKGQMHSLAFGQAMGKAAEDYKRASVGLRKGTAAWNSSAAWLCSCRHRPHCGRGAVAVWCSGWRRTDHTAHAWNPLLQELLAAEKAAAAGPSYAQVGAQLAGCTPVARQWLPDPHSRVVPVGCTHRVHVPFLHTKGPCFLAAGGCGRPAG